ncbi:archaeal transmembrane protein [Acidianus two-tailed phage variant 1]|nr:archaeal transmembrane protein [Acidianus two-tailed phage variant 1]
MRYFSHMKLDRKKKRLLLKTIFSIVILILPLTFLHPTNSTVSSQNQVPIQIIYNYNVSGGVIYTAPLNIPSGFYNYYMINQYGTLLYSYLFSTNPAFVVWYEPQPTTETYYFVYGQSVTSQLVSTDVFSLYTQFYIYNSSMWNISNGVVSGGVLTLNGKNSILTENYTAPRYTSALWLYQILSPQSVSPTQIVYTSPIPPGSLIIVHVLTYTGSYQVPYPAIAQYNTPYIIAESYTSQYLTANSTHYYYYYNSLKYVGSMQQSLPFITTVSTNGLIFYSSAKNSQVLLPGATLPATSYTTNSTFIAGQLVGTGIDSYSINPSFVWCPEWIVNGSIQLLNGCKVPITGHYQLDKSTYAVILNSVFNSSDDELIAPVNSIVTVTYSNGTSYSFTVTGSSIYSGLPVPLVVVKFYGVGVTGIHISTNAFGINQQYSALIGFTDLLHTYGVLIQNGEAYSYIAGTKGPALGNVTFPMVVAVGEFAVGNTYYVFGEIVTTSRVFPFIQQSSYAIQPTIAYVNYNGTIPLVIQSVAETLSTGTYYELSGIAAMNVGQPTPINSVILSVVSQPGLEIVGSNGNVYSTIVQNTSAPNLVLVGFQGYSITLVYTNVQQNLVVTTNNFPVNLPSDMPLLVAIDQASRSITITVGQTQTQSIFMKTIPVNTTTPAVSLPIPNYPGNIIVDPESELTVISYYIIGAVAIVSMAYGTKIWIGVFIFAISLTVLTFVFQMYSLIPLLAFSIMLGYMLKKMNY